VTTAAALAAIGPVLNPLVSPRVAVVVTFPSLSAAAYGGKDKVLADFSAIVASTAALDGPQWVQATATSLEPVTINATVRARFALF
jgi:hypothetical protein